MGIFSLGYDFFTYFRGGGRILKSGQVMFEFTTMTHTCHQFVRCQGKCLHYRSLITYDVYNSSLNEVLLHVTV